MDARTSQPFAVRQQSTVNVPQQPDPAPWTDVLGAGFKLENDMLAIANSLSRPNYRPDPDFDIMKAVEESDLGLDYFRVLARAQSQEEFDALSQRVREEKKNRELLAGAGWGGFAAGMAGAMFSPTMFIPLVGPARGVKGVAQAFGLAATAATAQEVALAQDQLLRTNAETWGGIAAGTVLGGLLGSAAVYLRRTDFDRVASGMAPSSDNAPISTLVRRSDGGLVRQGEVAPLNLPEEFQTSPRQIIDQVAEQRVRAATSAEDLRRLTDDVSQPPAVRELAREVQQASAPEQVAAQAARAEGYDEVVSQAWADYVVAEARGSATTQAFEAWERFTTVLARTTQDDPTVVAQVLRTRADALTPADVLERVQAQRAATAESTVSAKQTAQQFIPQREIIDADGNVTYEPITDMVDAGKWANPGLLGRVAAQMSPVLRATGQSFSPVLRRTMQKLSDAGVMWEGNKYGLVAAPGGTVESLVNGYQTYLYQGVKAVNDAYIEYVFGPNPTRAQKIKSNFLTELDRAPGGGKLSYSEFKAEITRALNRGDKTEIPQAQRAVGVLREIYSEIDEVAKEAAEEQGLPPMYGELRLSGVDSYLNHVFDRRKVSEKTQEFIEDVARHIESKLEENFQNALRRMQERISEEDDYLKVLQMERDEAETARSEVQQFIKERKEQLDFNSPVWDQIEDLRAQAKELRQRRYDELVAQSSSDDPETLKGLERLARRETRDEYEDLMNQAKRLEKNIPEPELKSKMDLTKARSKLRALNASVGRLEQQRAEALMRLESIEDDNIAALERLTHQAQKTMRQLERLSDDKLDAEVRRLEAQFDKTAQQIDKGEERIQRLYQRFGPEGSEFEPTERLSVENFRQQQREARLEGQAERLDRAVNFDRQGARAQIEQKLTEAIEYTNKVNTRRAMRAQKLRERVDDLDPEQVKARVANAMEQREKRLEAFEERLRESGATDIRVTSTGGRFSFAEFAKDQATIIANQISGSSGRLAQFDQIQSVRGFMKYRMLDLPYEVKQKYLETDIERVLAMYLRTMGPDIELYRAFGAVNGESAITKVREDFDRYREYLGTREVDEKGKPITKERREKQLKEFNAQSRQHMNELRGVIDRIRNQRGIPENPDDVAYRLGRFFVNWNVPTMMGVAAITSIPDAGRAVMAHGLTRVFRDSWAPFIKSLVDDGMKQQQRHVVKQLQLMGIGIDTYTQARAIGTFDLFDTVGRQTAIERGMEWAAYKTPKIALFGQWTDVMKTIAGSATMARVVRGVQDIAEGTADQNTITYLASINIDQQSARRIWDQLSTPEGGTKYKDLIIPNTESWTDAQALRVFKAAMQREDHRIVISPGVERPLMQDANIIGRLVFQFRSFTMAANTKMLISGLQQRDMALFHALQGTVFSLALGTLSYYIWAMTAGERARNEMLEAGWEEWLDQAIYRSGLLGAFSEAQVIGSSIPATRGFTTFADSDIAGRRATNVMGAVLGPSFGKAQDISQFLVGIDEPTQGTLNQARKLVPYQNVFYLRRALDMVTEGLGETLNLPERRQ